MEHEISLESAGVNPIVRHAGNVRDSGDASLLECPVDSPDLKIRNTTLTRRTEQMTTTRELIRRASRRMLADRMLRLGGRGLAIGATLAVAAVIAQRLLGVTAPWWASLIIVAVAGGLGLLIAILRSPTRLDAAIALDRALHLKDRIGSAVAMDDSHDARLHDDAWAELVRRHADTLAGRVDVRNALPVRITGDWGLVVVLAAALGAIILWMPIRTPSIDRTPTADVTAVNVVDDDERDTLAATIQDVKTPLDELAADEPDEDVREAMDSLDRLADQLAAPSNDAAPISRDDVAAQLDEVASTIERDAQRELDAVDKVAETFEGLATNEAPMTTREFADALSRGEFGRAADELDALLRQGRTLSDAERRAAAEHLRTLNAQAEQRAFDDEQRAAAQRESLENTLRREDIDPETARDLLDDESLSPAERRRRLREQGLDELAADDLARDIESWQRDKAARDRAAERLDGVRDALDDAADELDPSSPDPPNAGASSGPASPDRPDQRAADEPSDAGQRPDARRDDGSTEDGRQGKDDRTTREPSSSGDANRQRPADASEPPPTSDGERTDAGERDPAAPTSQQQRPAGSSKQQPSESAGGESTTSSATTDENTEPSTPTESATPVGQTGGRSDTAGDTDGTSPAENAPAGETTREMSPEGTPGTTPDKTPGEAPGTTPNDAGAEHASTASEEKQGATESPAGEQQQPADPTGEQQQPGGTPSAETIKRLADRMDPETLKKLADNVDPETLKKLADNVDPETLKRLAEDMDPETLEKLSKGVDPETRRKLEEAFDRQTIDELADRLSPDNAPSPDQPTAEPPPADRPANTPGSAKPPSPEQTIPEARQPPQDGGGAAPHADQPQSAPERAPGPPRPSPAETFRGIERERDAASSRRNLGERARDAARDVASGRTSEDRDRLQEAMRRERNTGTGASGVRESDTTNAEMADAETEDLELRDEALADDIIATWLSDEPPGNVTGTTARQTTRAERAQRAREVAERAVNETSVPTRYHDLIRRYFRSFDDTVERAADTPAKDRTTE